MSDQSFGHEIWLSRLKDHLQQERYAARTTERCLVVARHFLASLQKQNVDVSKAKQADMEAVPATRKAEVLSPSWPLS